jgi:aspartate-semialdehyde dehydrogenase
MQLTQRPAAGNAARNTRASRQRVFVVKAAKTSTGPRIAIVGVTGAVGQEFLTVRPPLA